MDKNLFGIIVKRLGDDRLDNFSCVIDNCKYMFKDISEDEWEDDGTGKYYYKLEKGQLIEVDEEYNEIKKFQYGITRSIQRSGSYFSDWHHEYEPYEPCEIKEVLIPEKIIPAHTVEQWSRLNICLDDVVDDEMELKGKLEEERIKLENEQKEEELRLKKLYSMNKPEIIQKVSKSLKKKNTGFTMADMRKEYYEIVKSGKLESQDWLDYHKAEFE